MLGRPTRSRATSFRCRTSSSAHSFTRPAMTSAKHRRLVVTAAVVAVVAFGIGWMLGRGSGRAPRHAGAAVAATLQSGLTGSALPTVAPDVLGEPSTMVAAGWTSVEVNVDPRAAALGIDIVGARSGGLIELDASTGALAELATETRYEQPPQLDAGRDWFLVRRPDVSVSELF